MDLLCCHPFSSCKFLLWLFDTYHSIFYWHESLETSREKCENKEEDPSHEFYSCLVKSEPKCPKDRREIALAADKGQSIGQQAPLFCFSKKKNWRREVTRLWLPSFALFLTGMWNFWTSGYVWRKTSEGRLVRQSEWEHLPFGGKEGVKKTGMTEIPLLVHFLFLVFGTIIS